MLTAAVDWIASVQRADGVIPWYPGGHADPWNHVEAAMALTVGGRPAEARAAYEWLARTQRRDGAWWQYYRADGSVEVAVLDANVTAYVATGVWQHYLATGDRCFLVRMWPVVRRAARFVLDLQAPGGEIVWARHADGTPWSFALLTASSSTCLSLGCAAAIASELDRGDGPGWQRAADAVAAAVRANRPGTFLPKDRWAMDWYYPVLTGIVVGEQAQRRLDTGWDRFVIEGRGVRCVADRPWVTTAETAEASMAYRAAGRDDEADRLLAWVDHLRVPDGSYFTGMVWPDGATFPAGERTTYSAAAVVLATAVAAGLRGPNVAAGLHGPNAAPGRRGPNAAAAADKPEPAVNMRE